MAALPELQSAYLLHSRDYRDTSLIVELFTPDQGRIAAVGRGAKTARRGGAPRALLQPFQPLWVTLAGRGELKSLRGVEQRATPLALRGRALFSGLYINELLCRVLPHEDPQPDLFADYEAALASLADALPLDIVLRRFELRLLDALGYGLSLETDASSGADLDPSGDYGFDPQRGLLPLYGRIDTIAFRGGDLLDFAAGRYTADARRALKALCRMALRPHLGEQPLRSRLLFAVEH